MIILSSQCREKSIMLSSEPPGNGHLTSLPARDKRQGDDSGDITSDGLKGATTTLVGADKQTGIGLHPTQTCSVLHLCLIYALLL